MENNTLDSFESDQLQPVFNRRRDLLPWWIKSFCWLFMVMGSAVPFAIIAGLMGKTFHSSFYGLETNEPFSMIGIILLIIITLKGITAFCIWTEKNMACKIGQLDAITGIVLCVFTMCIYPHIDDVPGFNLNIRLELLLLVPYYLKLKSIEPDWKRIGIRGFAN
jgi:hypothetical protein